MHHSTALSEQSSNAVTSSQVAIARTPLYLPSLSQSLFSWLHRRPDACRHGVVICPPTGYEQLHSHRSLRHLADALARRRFPVLRLDYHGTGDSAGMDEAPQRQATWLANIQDACAWMRQELGCEGISLVGLRLGASLAALAAADEEIDSLVLWAPVVKGSQYVREMKAISSASLMASQIAQDTSGSIQAAGFVLTKETAEEVTQLDLLRVTPRCSQVLIMSRDEIAGDVKLCEQLCRSGVKTERMLMPGYADMMIEPHYGQVPTLAIEAMADWLERSVVEATFESLIADSPADVNDIAIMATDLGVTLREQICRIHDEPHLFGILSEPERATSPERPLIVLLNGGSAYHIGPSRLYVLLARRLAAAGFRVLRADLNGLGDSVASNPARENDPYSASAFRDIELILEFAQQQLRAPHVVLAGLCSGAYDAFQAAAQSPNKALVESILINPLTFFWKDGMSLDASPQPSLNTWLYYLNAATDLRNWKKLLGGKSRLGLLGTLRSVGQRLGVLSAPAAETPDDLPPGQYGHPVVEDLPGDLQRAVAEGRNLAMFFSSTDPGHFLLKCQALRSVTRLRKAGRLSLFVIDDSDHTFSIDKARLTLISQILDYLRGRFP